MIDSAIVTDKDCNITALNKAACDMFGYEKSEILVSHEI